MVVHWIGVGALVAITLVGCTREPKVLVGQASVIDGDTIEIAGRRIRLEGIDAPESSQMCRRNDRKWRCGQRAAMALDSRISSRTVTCRVSGTDRYHRLLARCMIGNEDIQYWMVSQGWALAYRRYSAAYVPAEKAARLESRGIWAGEFDAPWEWRRNSARPRKPPG